MDPVAVPSPLQLAHQALDARHDSPQISFRLASDLLRERTEADEATMVALWALGLAARELNDFNAAERHLHEAAQLGQQLGLTQRAVSVRSALMVVLTARGRPEEALRIAAEISGLGEAADQAEVEMRRATALEQIGQIEDAIKAYTTALPAVRLGDDRLVEVRLLSNRGIALAYQGRTQEAIADSLEAEQLALDVGQPFLAGCAAHNAGFVYGREGDVVAALAAFDRADKLYAEVGYPGRCDGVLAADRCAVLLVAGLNEEALASATLAVEALEDAEDVNDLTEARLLLAQSLLAAGNHQRALAVAVEARNEFLAADRSGWAALAEHVALRSALLGDLGEVEAKNTSLDGVERVAVNLDDFGWPAEAISVRVSAAELAVRQGNIELASRHLESASTARHRGQPDRRANAWLATAKLRQLQGNASGAQRAVEAGLRMIQKHQASLGATELKAGATVHAGELADVGIDLAIRSSRPRSILRAAERVRANALKRSTAPADGQDHLRVERARLRELQTELAAGEAQSASTTRLSAEIASQESRLRHLARQVKGSGELSADHNIDQLFDELRDAELIEFVEHGGRIGAVRVANRRCHFRDLVDVIAVMPIIEAAQFSITRAGRRGASEASLAAAIASLDECASQLDELLIQPLRLAAERTVIVPTGALHGVAWGSLPTLRDRAMAVAPSARRWSTAGRTRANLADVRVILGPGLAHSEAEHAAVERHYPNVSSLSGHAATVDATLDMLDGAAIAHVVCHGTFRADSPMFSALHMADGSLNVYDLEELRSPPQLVVLPACNAATTDPLTGDELIGTSSALLGIGVQTVIAPIAVINDEATVPIMDRFHSALSTGLTTTESLRRARVTAYNSGDPASIGVGSALVAMQ